MLKIHSLMAIYKPTSHKQIYESLKMSYVEECCICKTGFYSKEYTDPNEKRRIEVFNL